MDGRKRLVRLALEYGADPEVRDSWHQRAIDITVEWVVSGMGDFLREVSSLDMDVESDLGTVWSDASSSLNGINVRSR